jgi:acetate kinase
MRRIEVGMPVALAFNPGSASLKFDLIELAPGQTIASEGRKLLSASIEGIGKDPKLLVFEGRKIAHEESCDSSDMKTGASFALDWLRTRSLGQKGTLDNLLLAGVRVVHGGEKYIHPVRATSEVKNDISHFEELAPLHNRSSLEVLAVLEQELPRLPVMVAFDTSFHCTLPERAWRYPIPREIADRLGVRKFGFHGLSHRYMVEQYAHRMRKNPHEVTVVTLHLESGSSAAAIKRGRSIDTTMGLTPLEGLMMGTRSGSIDPAIVAYLVRRSGNDLDEVMQLLNKKSGLFGIANEFDTRVLMKRQDDTAKLALEMFSYRVQLAVGAYLAALGDAEAVIFGGGIGEDTPLVRAQVCAGLRNFGMDFDEETNQRITSGEGRLTTPQSRLHGYVIPVEEGLQIAHECYLALHADKPTFVSVHH